jgi:uncharacterized protein
VSTEPVRRCIGCGRRAPKRELARFAALDGWLVAAPAGRRVRGRGAYTCRRLVCFERAAARRAFARALRTSLRVDPELSRLYTEDTHG